MSLRSTALGLLLTLVAGCAAFPAAPIAPPSRVLDAHDGGRAAIALTVSLAPTRRLLSAIRPYDGADVNHLVVTLSKRVDGEFVDVLDADGQPVAIDLTGPEAAGSVTLGGLRRSTTYRLQAKGYRAPGTDLGDLITRDDATSYSEVTIGTDDAPMPLTLQATTIARPLTVAFTDVPTPFDDDPGTAGAQPAGVQQTNLAIAYSETAGRYLAAWRDDRLSLGHPSLFVQALETDGTPASAPLLLSDGSLDAGAPAIAYDSVNDRFLVVWSSQTTPGEFTGEPGATLRARVVDPDGSAPGDAFLLDAPVAGHSQTAPTAVYSALEHAYVIAWENVDDATSLSDVVAMRLDAATLTPGFSAVSVDASGEPTSSRTEPVLCMAPESARAVIAFVDDAGDHGTVRYVALSLSGVAPASLTAIASTSGTANQRHPALAHDAVGGETMLVWDDGHDLVGQRLSSALAPLGPETAMLDPDDTTGDQIRPRVAFNPVAGEWLLTWLDFGASSGGEVFASRRDTAGAAIGSKLAVATGLAERTGATLAHATAATDNRSLLLWSENGHVFHRVLDSQYAP